MLLCVTGQATLMYLRVSHFLNILLLCVTGYATLMYLRVSRWLNNLLLCVIGYATLMYLQEAYIRWTRDRSRVNWEEFVRCQVRANETYPEAKRQFSDRNRDVLMNVQSPHKWWSTLKSAEFGSSSSLPPLVSVSRLVRLICCRIILTASSPGRLLIWRSFVFHLLVLSPLRSGRVR